MAKQVYGEGARQPPERFERRDGAGEFRVHERDGGMVTGAPPPTPAPVGIRHRWDPCDGRRSRAPRDSEPPSDPRA